MSNSGYIDIVVYAVVFVILFLIGGAIGAWCFPQIPGIFYIAGILFAIFGTGAGTLIINIIMNR